MARKTCAFQTLHTLNEAYLYTPRQGRVCVCMHVGVFVMGLNSSGIFLHPYNSVTWGVEVVGKVERVSSSR